jgi:peptide chain release factor
MTDVINIALSSGSGPEECRIAVERLVGHITAAATKDKLKVHCLQGPSGGGRLPRSVILTVTGESAQVFVQPFIGTVRFVFDSPVRKGHKRRNWFVGVTQLGQAALRDEEVALNVADVRFETLRAGGPGGQHQNTTDSAVRAIHVPTGLVTLARDERSQHRNKALALQRLADMLSIVADEKHEAEKRDLFLTHKALERGNAVLTITG